MNHWLLITSVLVLSSAFGLFLQFTRGKLTNKYSNEISFDQLKTGHELGKKATILQFKTEYCSICPGVKRQINELIKNDKGISFYEIDAVERIELAKKLHVKSSPTVLFFNEAGLEVGRIIGPPKKDQLRNTLEKITTIKMEKTNAN
jgi:thiol-disulfide isomerase/thioredoxin